MGCRCNERQQAITRTAQAVRTGDAKTAIDQVQFIARTTVQDVGSVMRQSIAAARAKLSRRG